MPALHPDLRRQLERTVIAARKVAEEGAKTVLKSLAVDEDSPFDVLSQDQLDLRERLQTEASRLGGFDTLVSEVAYEAWHSRLFSRFLLENGLLMYDGFAVSAEDLRDAEVQSDFGVRDPESLAVALAANMLPGLFEPQDPSWKLALPPEHASQLEKLLNELPPPVLKADDSLGWVYQFWQSAEKETVNAAGRGGNRIAAKDVPAVTQLFTEPYMVDWLLDQALDPLLQDPERDLSQLKLLDPCCGSGHFLVAAFSRISAARMSRSGLSAADAGIAVLAENLHGLELDPRCVQLAGFNLMFAAWKRGGYRELPMPQVACSGLPAGGSLREWQELAPNDPGLQNAMIRLYQLFDQAPMLGSLLDPRSEAGYIPWDQVAPALEEALSRFGGDDDPVSAILGAGARGIMRAVDIMGGQYDLVTTNVPYLTRGKHNHQLAEFCAKVYPASKADLATVFVERCLNFCASDGSVALVTPQSWLFLGAYKSLRQKLLKSVLWRSIAKLGAGAFETIGGEVVNVALVVLQNSRPADDSNISGWDVSTLKSPQEKAALVTSSIPVLTPQASQLTNPDARITLTPGKSQVLLSNFAVSIEGLTTGDMDRFVRKFWEIEEIGNGWECFIQNAIETVYYGARNDVIFWEDGRGTLKSFPTAHNFPAKVMNGHQVLGQRGIRVTQMGDLACTIYSGEVFGKNAATVVPHESANLTAMWCFCTSQDFRASVRSIDQSLKVTNGSLLKVPFDLEHWQKAAEERYPNGLPEPFSDDPTQWLFEGQPQTAHARGGEATLQVALGRLLSYRWPQQEADSLAPLADEDGILPLLAVSGETAGHERLRQLLEAALDDFSPSLLESLLADAGYGGKTLETYLRNGFFLAHCRMFQNRPFLWHIWDGKPDGFAAVVNYHKLDYARLEKLTYTYLGDYLKTQRDADQQGIAGAGAKVAAAEELQKKLTAILEGEPPYDIYVRWKKLEEQPIGWNPDLNDGVRLNIRPFALAGVLRSKFTINWNTDRGKNPDGSERRNDIHLTLAEKRAARGRKNKEHQ